MLETHRRTDRAVLVPDCGVPKALAAARADYERAHAWTSRRSWSVHVGLGNVLRFQCEFDRAIEHFKQAIDLESDVGGTVAELNIVNTLIERALLAPDSDPKPAVLVALGSLSHYLLWKSDGGPYPRIRSQIEQLLGTTGFPDQRRHFENCYAGDLADTRADELIANAQAHRVVLKRCVDRAIQEIVRAAQPL